MISVELGRFVRAEGQRWARWPGTIAVPISSAVAIFGLTLASTAVAAGRLQSSGNVRVDVSGQLTARSTNAELISFSVTACTLILPLTAIIVAALVAGADFGSGTRLTLATFARRYDLLGYIRALIMLIGLALVAGISSILSRVALAIAIGGVDDLAALDPWSDWGARTGAVVAVTVIWGLLVYAAVGLSRAPLVVMIVALVYVVVIDGLVGGLAPSVVDYLPRTLLARVAGGTEVTFGMVMPTALLGLLLVAAYVGRESTSRPA